MQYQIWSAYRITHLTSSCFWG